MRFLITAGPTREYFDPIRYLSNASSGRIGVCLAARAKALGHHVTLVMGPTALALPEVDDLVRVTSAADMFEAVVTRFDGCDVFIAAAAVCDYRPASRQAHKIKKVHAKLTAELERTADILGQMSKRRHRGQTLVGFCLETEDMERRARGKMELKRLDVVVANGPQAMGADCQDAILIGRGGLLERLDGVTKDALAERVVAAIVSAGRGAR